MGWLFHLQLNESQVTTLFSILNLRCWSQKSFAEEHWWNNLNSKKFWPLPSLFLTLSHSGLSSSDCFIINTRFQLTVASHVFRLLLKAPIQQEWVLTPFTHSSHVFSPSKKHRIPQNLLPHWGKLCTMCFESALLWISTMCKESESLWMRVDTSHSLYRMCFIERICGQTRQGKIFRMLLHCFPRTAFFNISKKWFFFLFMDPNIQILILKCKWKFIGNHYKNETSFIILEKQVLVL